MDHTKSTVQKAPNEKPVNMFFVWYTELCRRTNLNPAAFVKPTKSTYQTVLDFVADRLKVEEWGPVIQALRQDTSLHAISIKSRIGNCPFLHDVDTEEKAICMKRKYGAIWTAYVFSQLVKSLTCTLRKTDVLTYLELDGLPMFMHYLEPLLLALKKNSTLKTLSLSNSKIEDVGCQMVCNYLRLTPNVEVLNLSGCNLTSASGEYLAKLVKHQQINRYCESWHNSLRYENPEANVMRGIKRLTLNSNPNLGDQGLSLILDELEDDLWIKALDLQKCGITEHIASKLLDIVDYNKTLEIVDLRQNELLDLSTVDSVLLILKRRQKLDKRPEFQWCNTAVSISLHSIYESTSKVSCASNSKSVCKTKSAPVKAIHSKTSTMTYDVPVRKTRTVDAIANRNKLLTQVDLHNSRKQVSNLNTQLQLEIQKRKKIEKQNEVLQKRLDDFQSSTVNLIKCKVKMEPKAPDMIDKRKNALKINGFQKSALLGAGDDVKSTKNHVKIDKSAVQNGHIKKTHMQKNGFYKINGYKNGVSSSTMVGKSAYTIFEKLVSSGEIIEENLDEEELLTYIKDEKSFKQIYDNTNKFMKSTDEVSTSQASLLNYIENLKND